MSFRENAEDDYWGWDHTGSESIVEGSDDHDERTFVDDEHERIFLDEEPFEFDKNRQVELRATDAVEAIDNVFPTDPILGSFTPVATNHFSNQTLHNSNNGYQQNPVNYFPQLEQCTLDTNGTTDAHITYNDSTETDASTRNRTRLQLRAQHHEPQGRVPSTAQSILQAFFDTNPNPTLKDWGSLAQLTRLTTPQVKKWWFKNTRHRWVPPSTSSFSTIPVQEPCYIGRYQGGQQYAQPIGCNGFNSTPTNMEASSIPTHLPVPHRTVGDHGMQSPSLQAYRNTPPRDDAPPVIVSGSVIGFPTNRAPEPIKEVATPVGRDTGPSESWVEIRPDADWHSSFNISRGSTQMSSAPSLDRMAVSSKPGRQGKRKTHDVQALPRERIDPLKRFQCICCFMPFKTSSGMRRHIETQHDPQKSWICMREGPDGLRVLNNSFQPMCILCHSLNPGDDHFHDSHNVLPCLRKVPSHSFDRKDHLSGHITNYHNKERRGLPGLSNVLKQWEAPLYTPDTQPIRYCGFCQTQQVGWQKFINHIAKHFSEGYNMTMWFDPPAYHN